MSWIYLSPHYDDAVYSCGGLIWEQAARGTQVEIWTICAGQPPSGPLSAFAEEHHTRWETGPEAVEERQLEDLQSCQRVGADFRRFPVPDCIYRKSGGHYLNPPAGGTAAMAGEHLYTSHDDLFGPIHPAEAGLVEQLGSIICSSAAQDDQIVCPIAIGGHVDHRLTRAAAEASDSALLYYLDFPYILKDQGQIDSMLERGWQRIVFEISSPGFEAWYEGIAAHRSQISTFWKDLAAMRTDLIAYLELNGGISLWRMPAGGEQLRRWAQ